MRSLLKPQDKARIIAISIDDHVKTKEFAAKIAADGKGQIKFPLLADTDGKVIHAYGLVDHRYDGKSYDNGNIQLTGIPYDAIYVIDKKGRVAYAAVEEDYKVHPTNAEVHAALDALK